MALSKIFWMQVFMVFSSICIVALLFSGIRDMFFRELDNKWKQYVAALIVTMSSLSLLFVVPTALTIFDTGAVEVVSDLDDGSKWDNLVNRTHPNLLEGLRRADFRDVPPIDISAYMHYSGSLGIYQGITRTMYVPARVTHYRPSIYWHELGHHIWYYLLTSEEKDEFAAINKRDMEELPSCDVCNDDGSRFSTCDVGFANGYATTNLEEDWAESFEWYVTSTSYYDAKKWVNGRGKERAQVVSSVLERLTGCGHPACVRDRDGQ